ncbi:MAG: hypothetical protein ACYCW6_27130, partial [Candidatus Xenobia bacterium]
PIVRGAKADANAQICHAPWPLASSDSETLSLPGGHQLRLLQQLFLPPAAGVLTGLILLPRICLVARPSVACAARSVEDSALL